MTTAAEFTTEVTYSTLTTEAYETGKVLHLAVGTTTHPDRAGMVVCLRLGDQDVWLSAPQAFEVAEQVREAAAIASYSMLMDSILAEQLAGRDDQP